MNVICKVSLCDRRTSRRYKNQEKPWYWLRDRNRVPVRTTETAEEYPKLPKAERDEIKDQGGFVGGWLREGIRKNGNVICRTVGALDADNIPADVNFPALVRATLSGVEWFLYSTHKHTPETPRFRLVILFDREVSEEEYPALMRQVAHDLGMDYFDDSTYQANRMMYWASCPSNGVFVFEESGGCALPVDRYLARYENWRDTTQWPTSSRESEIVQKSASRQEDPLAKPGIVGTFCRTFFPIQAALEKFLPEVYAPTDHDGRWDYIPADSTAGVVIYDDRFVYSHHTTDPACGKLLNAFDIVRIHKFGDEDSKKSFKKMSAFALDLPEVKLALYEEKQLSLREDFGNCNPTGVGAGCSPSPGPSETAGGEGAPPATATDDSQAAADKSDAVPWQTRLRFNSRSHDLENSVWNLLLILNNDPDFSNIVFNELFDRVEVKGPVPWDRPDANRFWRDADTNQLKALLDIRYTVFTNRNFEVAFGKTVADRSYHPIREYLESLPPWDGVSRIETLFQRCFMADDTPYVRAVARKIFSAAVARIFRPGTKFDSVLVLDGDQGIGKSTLFRELAGDEYYSDSLLLTDISDKTGAEKLQGVWIVEIGELAGMRKADIEKVKAFLSTPDDVYRPAFGRTVESHPRQCIIVATVNGERGYLRDITGNRRFWIVKCHQTEECKRYFFSAEERDQIWAEAVHFYRNGEKLYLEPELRREAEVIQRASMEEDDRQGIVEAYLDSLLPLSWPDMDIYARRSWLSDPQDPTRLPGVVRRETVSNVEIWTECFENNSAGMKKQDSYEIAAIMARIGGWDKNVKRERIPLYGMQRLYVRQHKPDPRKPTKKPSPSGEGAKEMKGILCDAEVESGDLQLKWELEQNSEVGLSCEEMATDSSCEEVAMNRPCDEAMQISTLDPSGDEICPDCPCDSVTTVTGVPSGLYPFLD